MQQLHQLLHELRQKRKNGLTYEEVAKECNVFTPSGKPDRGMVYQLLHGYDPVKPETRKRLGLPPICPFCKRRLGERKSKKDNFSMTRKELQFAFEQRTDML
jgi:hypothetical protein